MTTLSPALQSALAKAKGTKTVVVRPGGLTQIGAVFTERFPGRRAIVVADLNTYPAAGARAQHELVAAGIQTEEPFVFQAARKLKADSQHARDLEESLRDRDCIVVAVGSGVINDLGKYASSLLERPYLCVPTAASMDGYSASGASLLDDGFKRTMPCAPPEAIVADLDVVRKAPAKMAGWGFGDLAGKLVAALDWQIADALGEDPIDPLPFAMVQDNLARWLSDPQGVARGDENALHDLMSGLLISGFAIQAHGNSRPASGSEHQFAHLWEMEGLEVDGNPASHGSCVGLASIAMLAIYARLLEEDVPAAVRRAEAIVQPTEAALKARLECLFVDPPVLEAAWREARAKLVKPELLRQRRERIMSAWPELLPTLRARFMPAAEMAARLRACGAPVHPDEMNMTLASLERDFDRARFVRRRYTALDLLADTGLQDRLVAAAFASDGYWSTAD